MEPLMAPLIIAVCRPRLPASQAGSRANDGKPNQPFPKPVPVPPDAFENGGACSQLAYTNTTTAQADRSVLAKAWRETVTDVFRRVESLDYSRFDWADEVRPSALLSTPPRVASQVASHLAVRVPIAV